MNYRIRNVGCDDETEGVFTFTEEQFEFLKGVFEKLNEYSTYGCMPRIYIEETAEQPTEPIREETPKAKPQKERTYRTNNKCVGCGLTIPDGERYCFMCKLEKGLEEYQKTMSEHLKQPSSLYLNLKKDTKEMDGD